MSLADRVVLVTGAAGGLGQPTALRLAKAGAKLALVDRQQNRLEEQCGELQREFGALLLGGIDLTESEATQAMVRQAVDHFGRLDGLVNIAGGYWPEAKTLHTTSLEGWDFLVNLNLKTVYLACKAAIPAMIEGGRGGKIVNISARSGLQAGKGGALYAATKAGVLRLTEAMAAELAPHRINVNALLPYIIDTAANRASMPDADFSRWVTADDLAEVMLFLLSDASRAINGASIVVPGYDL